MRDCNFRPLKEQNELNLLFYDQRFDKTSDTRPIRSGCQTSPICGRVWAGSTCAPVSFLQRIQRPRQQIIITLELVHVVVRRLGDWEQFRFRRELLQAHAVFERNERVLFAVDQ